MKAKSACLIAYLFPASAIVLHATSTIQLATTSYTVG